MKNKGIGLFGLIGMVVGSCIGTGAFAMTGQIAAVASPGAALIAFIVVGVGFAGLALSFSNLGVKKPELSGIYSYAQEGFGPLAGFISGWGYWLSAWLGNVAYATILCSTIGYFFPVFLPGNTLPCIIFASLVLWLMTYLVIRGVESASALNTVVTIVKVGVLLVFIGTMVACFKHEAFTIQFWTTVQANVARGMASDASTGGAFLLQNISSCFIVIMWAFIGIEGATVLSSRARNKKQIGLATLIGLGILLFIYATATVLPYGVLPIEEIASMDSPAAIYVFESVFPGWGGAFISIGIIISIIGAWLSFTILPVQTVSEMAHDNLIPAQWGKLNKNNSPQFSLIVVAFCVQVLLITLIVSSNAYNFASAMCTVSIIFSWVLAAAFQVKISVQNKEYFQVLFGVIAIVVLAAGTLMKGYGFVLLACLGCVPGFYFYFKARKKQGKAITKGEKLAMAVFTILGAISIVLVAVGVIQI